MNTREWAYVRKAQKIDLQQPAKITWKIIVKERRIMHNTLHLTNNLLLNTLGSVDRNFFAICGIIIVVIVAIYFLIPVFRKEQYKTQRENLREREKAFNAEKQARNAKLENSETVDLSASEDMDSDDK